MELSDSIAPQLHAIGESIHGAKRSNPKEKGISGWGQFLDVEEHKEQIGPYGTCSVILFNQIMNPEAEVDRDVVAQIKRFWEEASENRKLRRQNVRLAFLIVSLAGLNNPDLVRIRDEAVQLLLQRQNQEGAWGDWAINGSDGSPRQETTAWILLALNRLGTATEAVKSAQGYLLRRVGPSGTRSTISDFAAAVLLETVERGRAPRNLISRAKSALRRFDDEGTERIQFFDYFEESNGDESPRLKRDYLCYPALLSFALLTSGLTKHSRFLGQLVAAKSRISLSVYLQEMVGSGSYYILPGAARASTVDQAIIALSFECLRNSEAFYDSKLLSIRPIISIVKQNILFRLVLPILMSTIAIVSIQDPGHLLWLVPDWTWIDRKVIEREINDSKDLIRIVASVFLFFANSVPGNVVEYVKGRLW